MMNIKTRTTIIDKIILTILASCFLDSTATVLITCTASFAGLTITLSIWDTWSFVTTNVPWGSEIWVYRLAHQLILQVDLDDDD